MPKERMHAVFCDSIADLERCVAAIARGEMNSKHVGIRLRTPNVVSRFGIPVDSPATFRKLIDAVTPPDVTSVRAKSSGHGKKTADKWNQ